MKYVRLSEGWDGLYVPVWALQASDGTGWLSLARSENSPSPPPTQAFKALLTKAFLFLLCAGFRQLDPL